MAEVGSAFVSILPSAKGFGKNLAKQVEPETKKTGSSIGKTFGKTFAAAGGAMLGYQFLKGAISQASDLNEAGTKINAIFGKDGSKAVQAFAAQGAKTLGQTKLEVLDAASNFGTFGKAAGLAGQPLAKFSTGFAGLATDMASFFNTSPAEAVEAISSGLRGEAEPLRKYGVLLDDATLRQSALRLGLIKTTKQALTPQQKVLAAQAEIYRQTKDAQGDFARTSGGLANQSRILKAQFTDLQGTIGNALLPVLVATATFVNNRVVPAVTNFIGQMRSGQGAGGQFASVLSNLGSTVATVFGFLQAHKTTITTFVAVLLTIVGAIRIWIGVQAALNFVLTANPIGLVVVAIAALVTGLILAYKRSETFRNIVNGAFKAVVSAGKFMWGALKGYFKFIINAWLTVAGAIIHGAAKAFGWIPGIGPKIKKLANQFDDFKANVNKALNGVNSGHAVAEVNKLRNALDDVKDKKVTITTMFVNKGKPAGGGASGLPGQAAGTNDWRGGPTWVGERGPEIVNLPRHSQVIPNHKLNSFGGGGRQALTITNWRDGTGYIETIAEGSVRAHAGVGREAIRSRR